jgi:heat shock protein HtpX
LSVLLVGLGGAIGGSWTWILLGVALAMNLGSYFFSDRIVLAMHRAQELGPDQAPALHRMVEDIAGKQPRRNKLNKSRVRAYDLA